MLKLDLLEGLLDKVLRIRAALQWFFLSVFLK
jgi:hypothetical protein